MSKVWEWIKWGVAQIAVAPVSFYEYVKSYPGQVVILWPLTLGITILVLWG